MIGDAQSGHVAAVEEARGGAVGGHRLVALVLRREGVAVADPPAREVRVHRRGLLEVAVACFIVIVVVVVLLSLLWLLSRCLLVRVCACGEGAVSVCGVCVCVCMCVCVRVCVSATVRAWECLPPWRRRAVSDRRRTQQERDTAV